MTQNYIGTKLITAWEEIASKNTGTSKTGDPGYAVKYSDGYISWSPKAVFENAYLPIGPDEPTGFIGHDVVEDFIVSHEVLSTDDSVTVQATLVNQIVIAQTVEKASLTTFSSGDWAEVAAQRASQLIEAEVTKHLTFLLACAQNGISFPQIKDEDIEFSDMDTEEIFDEE
ncbi:hypothetical protein [Leptothoe spongobia]|uniref:Uncharacterized protein n=1 Tax=Leptothoe spongobia TAU-MAC 1115 TaxID=1967444 RepID=A0A947DFR9_9CYAN|nr:hypothetical protein [Leptothoe spongobia]MBT9316282.1 hypothetical protein [Leptothoe spongobia TAU-MAC 1115]